MATAGKSDLWNGQQLAMRWMASREEAPAPTNYAIFRATRSAQGREAITYTVQDDEAALTQRGFEQWLIRQQLGGANRLGLALLVIREVLGPDDVIRECVIERRRGAVDGPLCGDPARIEFIGPAAAVRIYGLQGKDRLVERLPDPGEPRPTLGAAPSVTEGFLGEEAMIRARFGPQAVIVARRSPTLFEDLVGLSAVMHVQGPRGLIGCGIGWHGPMAFVLVADFPCLTLGLALSPDDERTVAAAIAEHKLLRHETRVDAEGVGVVARRRDGGGLVIVRPIDGEARVEAYEPVFADLGTADQQKWLRYAEAHEGRTILDAYQDGASDELVVLTGDAGGQVWQHRIDTDGLEVARMPANETAIARRERDRMPPHAVPGLLAMADPDLDEPALPRLEPDRNSLLAKVNAFNDATTLLRTARDVATTGQAEVAAVLRDLIDTLYLLPAPQTARAVRTLLRRAARANGTGRDFMRALDDLEQRLFDELAEIRVYTAPAGLTDPDYPLFSDQVAEAFPDARFHIAEVAQCLALRRPTAAAFHATVLLRCGLRAVTPAHDAQRWTELMAAVEEDPSISPPVTQALRDVRQIWHAPGTAPADKYTEEEAEALIRAIAAFLATIVDSDTGAGARGD